MHVTAECHFEISQLIVMYTLITLKCMFPSNMTMHCKFIRRWMILNKLKMNNAKTEFIIFKSSQIKLDLNSLLVNVGDSLIVPSKKYEI